MNNNKEHWCQKCVHQDELETKARNTENRSPIEALKVDERVPSPKPSSPLQTTSPDLGNVAASPVLPTSPSGKIIVNVRKSYNNKCYIILSF